ncbi:lactonase family protein [Streptomyces sp. YKOK-I1]
MPGRTHPHDVHVLTGSYTPDTGGSGVGLALLRLDPSSGALTEQPRLSPLPVSGASFLAAHPSRDLVYSTTEQETGAVSAVAVHRGRAPARLGPAVGTGGANPCHLTVHRDGNWLLTANYGSDTAPGSVAVHRLDADGSVGELTDVVVHEGSGPVTGRQDGSHAHQVLLDPAGRFVLATDLGADKVFVYRLDTAAGTLDQVAVNTMRAGSGPRHLAFAPGGDLVWSADELSSTVTCHRYDTATGTLTELSTTPATTARDLANLPGGIIASACGRFVWVTNRGADTVAAFRVTGSALQPIGEVPSAGAWPRGLAMAGGHLLVANQHGGTLVALRVLDTGALEQAGPAVVTPSVVCALGL